MDAIFLNTCVHSKENLLEMTRKTRTLSWKLLCYIEFLCCFTVSMSLLYEGHSIGSLIALAVLAFFILLYVFLPHLQVNRIIQECRIFFGSEMVIQSAFFDSKLVISSVQMKKEMVIEYEQIVRILKTKHLFLLEMRDSFILFVDQSGFSKGNQKDFETFIQLCAKNAKIQF